MNKEWPQKAQKPEMSPELSLLRPLRFLRFFVAILLPSLALTRVAEGQEEHRHPHHESATSAPATTSAHIPPDPPSHLMGPMSPDEMAEIMGNREPEPRARLSTRKEDSGSLLVVTDPRREGINSLESFRQANDEDTALLDDMNEIADRPIGREAKDVACLSGGLGGVR